MIHTIRKHSKWLLWIIAGLTIFSFVFFMGTIGTGPSRNAGGGGVNTNMIGGEIYGNKVSEDLYDRVKNDVDLDYLFSNGQWPYESAETAQRMQQSIYVRMMLVEKAKQLGVHVTDEQAETVAANFLHSPPLQRVFGLREDQSVPFNAFVGQVLTPRGLSADDFENFVRDDLAIEQLQSLYGLTGGLLTPQEATNEYVRENQEFSAQIVFFSASNYLNRISITPAEIGEYYTNYMADYRLPDRVQVSYVLFSGSNYLAEAQSEIGTSNLEMEVTNAFQRYGMQATPDAKTTNEAMADIRQILLRQQGLKDAATQADNFAQSVFSMEPASPRNLAIAAHQKGLRVETPAPFGADYGPAEFVAPAAFTRTAFSLTPDAPISEPVPTPNGVYLLALETNLPSEIPPLEEIRGRVTQDLRERLAALTAQRVGTNFAHQLTLQMATGKSFAAVGFADGFEPLVLSPFSLATQDVPELGSHATVNQLKEVAVSTPPGTASGFIQTDDGGFVLFVQSRLPIDQEKMATEMPRFVAELREQRSQQAFNDWVQHEASRQLRNTPIAREAGAR